MEWSVSVCCDSFDGCSFRLTVKSEFFSDVLTFLDILSDNYIMQSVLITRKPNDSEVYDETLC